MNLLERLKHQRMIYDCNDGWYVLGYGDCWYIGLIKDGMYRRTKKIGKIEIKRVNYFDKAVALAEKRNRQNNYTPKRAIPNYLEQYYD